MAENTAREQKNESTLIRGSLITSNGISKTHENFLKPEFTMVNEDFKKFP
jgi:hypothetical protein